MERHKIKDYARTSLLVASLTEVEADTIGLLYPVECDNMAFQGESVTAFNLQDFEIGVDIDGHLVMRLTHKEGGMRHQKTYALDFKQSLHFMTALVKATEQAEKFRDDHDRKQRFN
jgi:hypothetical protein